MAATTPLKATRSAISPGALRTCTYKTTFACSVHLGTRMSRVMTPPVASAITCGANQRVQNHVCTACPDGTTNAAGDDWRLTRSDITVCVDQRAWRSGKENEAGDDALQTISPFANDS